MERFRRPNIARKAGHAFVARLVAAVVYVFSFVAVVESVVEFAAAGSSARRSRTIAEVRFPAALEKTFGAPRAALPKRSVGVVGFPVVPQIGAHAYAFSAPTPRIVPLKAPRFVPACAAAARA